MAVIRVGQRLPPARLARIERNEIELVELDKLARGRRIVLVGLPGAFTPVCTGKHLPDLVENASRLKASGIDEIVCIAPNSPWVVEVWAERMDPKGQLTFLSDGNLDFTRAAGLSCRAPRYFLGECSTRFTMILKNAVIERFAIETEVDDFSCTRSELLL